VVALAIALDHSVKRRGAVIARLKVRRQAFPLYFIVMIELAAPSSVAIGNE
jgi:hypothetical protein